MKKLNRPVQLHFSGDWGDAGLHRIAGWISSRLINECAPPHTRTAIWSGAGGFDAAFAVGRGDVHIGLSTPVSFLRMAFEGLGPFADEPFPGLRGLGVIPQDDRLIAVVRKSLGFTSFEDIRRARPALRVALSPDDGRLQYGFAAHAVLAAHGLPREELAGWGGTFLEAERPDGVVAFGIKGEADLVIHEAIMAPWWHQLMESGDFVILPFEDEALQGLESEYRMKRDVLKAGALPTVETDTPVLDFRDFAIFTREDLPDDVAYVIAQIIVETRHRLEAMYAHIPANRCQVTYPIEPRKVPLTDIPLHPGAERYYREAGLL